MRRKGILSLNCLAWTLRIPRGDLEDLASSAGRHYHPFLLERSGKKPRKIDNPDRTLRNVQRQIYRKLLRGLEFPEYLHGGLKGRSPQTNASTHLGRALVVRLDLQDFFPSVTDRQVYSVWADRLGNSPPVASLLTALTTYRHHLPQGAPTSTYLANLVLLAADEEIRRAASEAGCCYTRFIDDLSFSGNDPLGLISVSVNVLREVGFRVSRGKLILMPASSRQEVTGLSVNSRLGPSVPRYRRDQVRAAIHQLKDMPPGKDFDRAVESVRGRIAQLSKINPGNAAVLFRNLQSIMDHQVYVKEIG